MNSDENRWDYNTTTPTTTLYPFFTTATHDPRLHEKIFGDFTAFYVTITICTVLGAFLFLLNIALCCCSRYKKYWQDSNTVSISVKKKGWDGSLSSNGIAGSEHGNRWILPIWTKTPHQQPPLDYTELEKCPLPPQQVFDTADVPLEYVELTHKKESDL